MHDISSIIVLTVYRYSQAESSYSNLFWRVLSVILLGPDFGIHLNSNVVKINFVSNIINVAFCNVISCVIPILVVGEC